MNQLLILADFIESTLDQQVLQDKKLLMDPAEFNTWLETDPIIQKMMYPKRK